MLLKSNDYLKDDSLEECTLLHSRTIPHPDALQRTDDSLFC